MSKCDMSVYLATKSTDMIDAVNKGYQQGISDERERIIYELEKAESYYRNLYREHSSRLDEKRAFGINKAIEIVRGDANE